ncbi:ABC transporter permease [Streptomyces avermitilis]|uniref:ABC transporter permease n=1 Tax=Streptomyces avermitilis TaxID=33903 RepID=UPI0033C73E4D
MAATARVPRGPALTPDDSAPTPEVTRPVKERGPWRTGLLLASPAIVVLALLFLAPLFMLVYNSFRTQAGDPTLHNYTRFLGDSFYRDVLWHTLWIGVLTTLGCLVVGYPFAVYLRGRSPRTRNYLSLVLLSPLLISMVTRAYGWLVLLGPKGPIADAFHAVGLDAPKMLYNDTAVVVGMVHVMLAYMVLPLMGSLDRIDPALTPAAKGLGASGWTCFWRITVPLSLPGMLAGSLIVSSLTVSSFVTPAILGGPTVKLMPYFVYTEATTNLNWPYAAAIGFVLIVVTTILTAAYARLLRGRGGKEVFA